MPRIVRVRAVVDRDGTLRDVVAVEVKVPGVEVALVLERPGVTRGELRAGRWLPAEEF